MDGIGGGELYCGEAKLIWSYEVFYWVIADVDACGGVYREMGDDTFKACGRGFPELAAEFFGVNYAAEIGLYTKCFDFEALGGQKAVGEQGEVKFWF